MNVPNNFSMNSAFWNTSNKHLHLDHTRPNDRPGPAYRHSVFGPLSALIRPVVRCRWKTRKRRRSNAPGGSRQCFARPALGPNRKRRRPPKPLSRDEHVRGRPKRTRVCEAKQRRHMRRTRKEIEERTPCAVFSHTETPLYRVYSFWKCRVWIARQFGRRPIGQRMSGRGKDPKIRADSVLQWQKADRTDRVGNHLVCSPLWLKVRRCQASRPTLSVRLIYGETDW